MKNTTFKRVLSVLLCTVMVLSTMTVGLSFTAGAANGDWVPMQYDSDIGYVDVPAGNYAVVDGNHAMQVTQSDSSYSMSDKVITDGDLTGASVWTFSKNTNGTYGIKYNTMSVSISGSAQFYITAVSPDTVIIQSAADSDIYLAYSSSEGCFGAVSTATPVKLYTYTPAEYSNNYVYERSTPEAGDGRYIIEDATKNNWAITYNGTSLGAVNLDSFISNDGSTLTIPSNNANIGNIDWNLVEATSDTYHIKSYNRDVYLRTNQTSIGIVTTVPTTGFSFVNKGNYNEYPWYNITFRYSSSNTRYLYKSSNNQQFSYTSSNDADHKLILFKLVEEPHVVTEESYNLVTYAIDPNKTIYTPIAWASLDTCRVVDVKEILPVSLETLIRTNPDFAVYTSSNSDYSESVKVDSLDNGISFDFSGITFDQVGTYTVPVRYGQTTTGTPAVIGTITVELLAERPVVSGVMSKNSGTLYCFALPEDETGATADVVRDNGSMDVVNITAEMLSGDFDLNTPDTYTGLSVTCGGKVICDDFTLTVKKAAETTVYEKYTPKTTTPFVENGNYLIYNANTSGLTDTSKGLLFTTTTNNSVTGTQDFTKDGDIITTDAANVFKITRSGTTGNNYTVVNSNGRYLQITSSSVRYDTSSRTVCFSRNNTYPDNITISNTSQDCYLYKNNGSFRTNDNIDSANEAFRNATYRFELYKEKKLYYTLSSAGTRTPLGDPFDETNIADVLYVNVLDGDTHELLERIPLTDERVTASWAETFDYNETGEYAYNIKVDDVSVGSYMVEVFENKEIVDVELVNNSGTVYENDPLSSYVGTYILVTYEDDSTRLVPVTGTMLSGDFDISEVDTYEGLTVSYAGRTLSEDFILYVIGRNDYPEYPELGSVKVDKSANAENFFNNGVARVQLSAAGVPLNKGIDMVVVLDTSSSMGSDAYIGTYNGEFVSYSRGDGYWYYEGGVSTGVNGATNSKITRSSQIRLDVLKQSVTNLLTNLVQPNSMGQMRDIDVAICGFNGMNTISGTNNPHPSDAGNNMSDNNGAVYTGTKDLTAGAFVNAADLQNFNTNSIVSYSGTNYDYAFLQAYELITAKQAQNTEERDLYVVFMSDGAPFQYNYLVSNNQSNIWNSMLKGEYTSGNEISLSDNTYRYFYNPDGNKHWMAEAIKGDPEQLYTIIDPAQTTAIMDVNGDGTNDRYMRQINGLGAKMYSIGFCLAPDAVTEYSAMRQVIENIASSEEYFYLANSAMSLDTAFDSINDDMTLAGTNAYFLDTMGACYDLQRSASYTKNGVTYELDPVPSISFVDYTLYTLYDYNTGVIDDYNLIGTRTGESKVIENITFNSDGTEAYSSKITQSGSPSVHPNIMGDDGVIYGSTFIYNTSQKTVLIDPNGGSNKTFQLPPETFYWNMNIIAEQEHCLEYDVYLTGSMEGTRPAGTYPTNESASLYYINYQDHPCHLDTVSPQLPWDSAKVGYEFYLVNANGEPVNTNGDVVPFANRVLVGKPQSKEILLNNIVSTGADVAAKDVIPVGYTLYNPDASFTVAIDSGSTPSSATISDTKNVYNSDSKVTTFYYDSNSICNKNGTVSGVDNYFDTHVAFAVILMPTVIPDAVVIDYGIPVSISLLANDLAIPLGTSPSCISETIGDDVVLNNRAYDASQLSSNTKSLKLKHGTAELKDNKLVYTPADAEMDEEEIIYYEVIVGGKYYYSTVTVYPAQNIYYEEDFFTFTPEENWQTAGTRKNAYQAEDRPGTFNNTSIDFNNVYGYDEAYDDSTVTYSLGCARYTRVDKNTPKTGENQPLAKFRFRGTGFDLFSVTSNVTGTTVVNITDESGNQVDRFVVDNYYGYKYTPGDEETFLPNIEAQGGIYQIPIIRARDYSYGTYTVIVEPLYSSFLDHQKLGYYDIYVDGIRIYDPAGDDPEDNIKGVYEEDTEADIQYVELRSNIISANDFYRLSSVPAALSEMGEVFPGAMFVDSIASLKGDIKEAYNKFKEVGPNNELYLSKGQAIAFYLSLDDIHEIPASIQLGMKVVTGDAGGSVYVMSSAFDKPDKIDVQGGAARYYDITNSFIWNNDLLNLNSQSGFAVTDAPKSADGNISGSYSESEWTFDRVSNKWKLSNNSGSGAVLGKTESGSIAVSMAPSGTGDLFTIESENGIFTFTNDSDISFEYNGTVVSGSYYNADSFYIYHRNSDDSYTRIMSEGEILDGEKYLIIYDSTEDKLVSPKLLTVELDSTTYKTLYPVVIMNKSDNILALTNFKVAFNSYSDDKPVVPKMMLSSNAKTANFAKKAVDSFVLDPNYDDSIDINVSDISTEFVANEGDESAAGTLYIRTPENIVSVMVGDETVTEFVENGDGTKTFIYNFDVSYNNETQGYKITVTDSNGNSSKIIKAGKLELIEAKNDEPEMPEKKGFLDWLAMLINKIIEFFKSIIKWVTNI